MVMLVMGFLGWWYGAGWKRWLMQLRLRLTHLYQGFSVPILLHTLFAPWRRIITLPGKSMGERLRAMVDNLVSRLVGFSVRLIVLFGACLLIIAWLVIGLVELVVWPLLPPLAIGLIIWGLV